MFPGPFSSKGSFQTLSLKNCVVRWEDLRTLIPCVINRTTHPGRWLRQPHLSRSESQSSWTLGYFLSTSFSEVHGTFRVMWPFPSVDLRFAVCMSELMSAISNTPSCWAIATRSPRFGVVMLVPVFIGSSSHRL